MVSNLIIIFVIGFDAKSDAEERKRAATMAITTISSTRVKA